MEIGSAKPIPVLPETREVPRVNASGAVPVGPTEVPVGQGVQQVNADMGAGGDSRRLPVLPSEMVDRRLEIDPATREIVFQAVDKQTGDVVRQFPDRAILRLRAYAKELRTAMTVKADGGLSEIA